MDLKEFIVETISSLVDATADLQKKYENTGVVLNPLLSNKERDIYNHSDIRHTYRRVEQISFDVAVTASSSTSGVGKGGLRVMSIEVGGEASRSISNESISRVSFSLPLVLPVASIEADNRENPARQIDEAKKRAENTPPEDPWILQP